jgi:uncharacterized protein (TIGR03435 family)
MSEQVTQKSIFSRVLSLLIATFMMLSVRDTAAQSNVLQHSTSSQIADAESRPMAVDVDPSFEVATIRPSNLDHPITGNPIGHRSVFPGTTVLFLVGFIYDMHDKQIVDAPDWMTSEKFDFEGVSDTPGTPDLQQVKVMFQKLLADRLQLKFHLEKRELSAYVLTVGKNGPKLIKSQDPNGMPSLLGRPQVGGMKGSNLTMPDFAHLLQSGILDRPVVDQTGLQGKYDFLLKWTPDESQFTQVGIRIPPQSETADAPPSLFTAIQEELGLRLAAHGKTPVQVLVIDHIEKPSAN